MLSLLYQAFASHLRGHAARFNGRRRLEMRTLLIFIAVTLALLTSVSATAKTPDGLTPAVETDCDVLIGATPGLYGLCVAYCEAHDAHILSPGGNPADLNVPNRRILENYNRKKTETDPPMPCVQQVPQGSCPCWTAGQLSMVSRPGMNVDVNYPHACLSNSSLTVLENFENGYALPSYIQMSTGGPRFERWCMVKNYEYLGGPADTGFVHAEDEDQFDRGEVRLLARHPGRENVSLRSR